MPALADHPVIKLSLHCGQVAALRSIGTIGELTETLCNQYSDFVEDLLRGPMDAIPVHLEAINTAKIFMQSQPDACANLAELLGNIMLSGKSSVCFAYVYTWALSWTSVDSTDHTMNLDISYLHVNIAHSSELDNCSTFLCIFIDQLAPGSSGTDRSRFSAAILTSACASICPHCAQEHVDAQADLPGSQHGSITVDPKCNS